MATTTIAFVANTNNLLLIGLKSELEGDFINSATVQVIVEDSTGHPVAGEDWPVTMTHITASNGDYVAGLSHNIAFLHGKKYTAIIDADGSDSNAERYGHWEFPFTANTRTS